MNKWNSKLDVVLVGGGMISIEVILPTLFQERREGRIGKISVSSLDGKSIKRVQEFFPEEEIIPYPDPDRVEDENKSYPDEFKKAIDSLGKYGFVIVATPDHFHTPVIQYALEKGRDVVCEKPLCLKVKEIWDIYQKAQEKGLYVYTDYHKRHDRAVRGVKYRVGKGDLGEILYGHAWIEEKKEMPLKNFALWAYESSSFEYIGVHYADVYYFVTGLKPTRLIGFAQKKFLPTQGMDVYDAVEAVIEWENGSVFWIQTNWVLPQSTTALTNQGLQITGTKGEYKADHKDRNCYIVTDDSEYEHYNPNFFKTFDSWEHPGEVDSVGYGYESLVQGFNDIRNIFVSVEGLSEEHAVNKRKEMIKIWEESRPLPNQALIGTAINEGVRLSMENGSRWVVFDEKMFPRLS